MLLSDTARTMILASSSMLAVAAFVVVVKLRTDPKLPVAQIRAKRKLNATRSLVAGVLVAAVACAYWAATHTIPVLVVEDGHSGYGERVLRKRLARSLDDFPIAPGGYDPGAWFTDPCWLVNRSSTPIRQLLLDYASDHSTRAAPRAPGAPQYRVKENVTIDTNARSNQCSFDYIGPSFEPPRTLADFAAPPMLAIVTWLTWD